MTVTREKCPTCNGACGTYVTSLDPTTHPRSAARLRAARYYSPGAKGWLACTACKGSGEKWTRSRH
ncbi:hypothetical protein CLV72_11291 [Allonocardiopsis opalescens]|uniref:Uncharacterized protein n=1 Tax=Allonocardiopsis opalescens TaxID=1144618 RepID=A0A2T0PT95_9ACTN|nr:hypothetical protein CLV72_11291 [Allonocardiopsis opalescens]